MRKINIGAGSTWYEDGWEVLDNGTGSYKEKWKHKGKCWDSNLPSNTFDIVFTSHMLEHIPHFRLEKTIAEFNRILKKGGTVRILVPHLKKAAEAYLNGDKDFFKRATHYSDHLGIGGSFVRVLISPGDQTVAISREMDEIFGGYAHLYSYDFEMMKILLEKWGFGEVRECEPGKSSIKEMQKFQGLMCNGKHYDKKDEFVEKKKFMKEKGWHFDGFDKRSDRQLVVEAKKVKDVPYTFDKEYEFNQGKRFDSPLDKLKIMAIFAVTRSIDVVYVVAKKTRATALLRPFRRAR